MDAQDLELIERLSPTNAELRHLWMQHGGFEAKLADLERVRYPSEGERREIGRVKRLKLRGKEQIGKILAQHRG
jgi:hypothetical protein